VIHVDELRPGDLRLGYVYERLLAPNFPPHELDTLDDIAASLTDGSASVLVAVDVDDPVGVAVGDWSATAGVMLLS
jgi:hypothetical protein